MNKNHMLRKPRNPFIVIGSASCIKDPYVATKSIAFSPVDPIIAEAIDTGGEYIIRITNYESSTIIGQVKNNDESGLVIHNDLLLFSPGGKSLLFESLDPFHKIVIYTEPWNSPKLIFRDTPKCYKDRICEAFNNEYDFISPGDYIRDMTWLDEQTVVVIGSVWKTMCIGLIDIKTGTWRDVYGGELHLWTKPEHRERYVKKAKCYPSGHIAFFVESKNESGEELVLFQLDPKKWSNIKKISAFKVEGNYEIFINEDGQPFYHRLDHSHGEFRLFNLQGNELAKIKISLYKCGSYYRFVHRDVCVCYRKSNSNSIMNIYKYHNGEFRLWGSRESQDYDLIVKDGKTLLADKEEEQTTVFELLDIDLVNLSSEDSKQRFDAVQSLGKRCFKFEISILTRLLWDENQDVQEATIEALVKIGNPEALPHMLRALGHKSTDYLRNELESALRRFPSTQLVPVVFDCITLTDVTSRLGAVRVLESMPAIEALGQLCEAIHDTDRNIRLSAAHALRKRADIRACVALMAHLNDENNEVRIAVNQAIIRILKTANVRSIPVRKIVLEPFNISLCAEEVISPDCIQEFEGIGNPLVCLAEACVKSDRPLPEILNAIDALTITKENSPMRVSVTIVISLSLIFAKVMREKKRLKEAIGIYSNATTLAKQIHSPHLEWRAWYAIGECFEILGDDVNAWKAFRNAMETIDRQWFALLEEDKPRYFFQDKARLYDQAVLCCLRLGHNALALECLEKSKTRYLGDIIARGQMNTLLALNQEIREFWKDIGSLRSVDGSVDSSQTIDNSEVEIVAVEWGNANIGTRVIKPKHRSVFEKISQDREEHKVKNYILKRLWQLMSNIATENNGRLS